MRANIPKQPKPPKAWQNLPPYQRKQIEQYALGIARDQSEKDARIMLDLYTKMTVCILHDGHKMDEEELLCFLGTHKQFFRRQRTMVQNGTQLEYLNGRMAEIFPTSGFPQDFFDGMLGPVETPTGEEQENVQMTAKGSESSARGEWIVIGDDFNRRATCPNCKHEYAVQKGMLQLHRFAYCPECGAHMKGE